MTIAYSHGLDMCKLSGSVFPSAMKPALASAIVTLMLNLLLYLDIVPSLTELSKEGMVFEDSAAWTGFSSLVGFLVVFRTSQAYTRFWDGCTACHMMRAEWFDACSSLCAFCKHSKSGEEAVLTFQNTLVRLFSMLHALALAEIEDCSGENETEAWKAAFGYELIDVEAIDTKSLKAIKECECKVELVFQWIQQLMVENIETGVLSIPPPILSRAFQELATGMVQFHDALKISTIPFPYPYAQCCDLFLVLHSVVTPFVMCQWVSRPWWAFILSFTQVFVLWCLNFISREIQNPFGTDANDIDSAELQCGMNKQLLLLLAPETKRTPTITRLTVKKRASNQKRNSMGEKKSFFAIWTNLESAETPGRRNSVSNALATNMAEAARTDEAKPVFSENEHDHIQEEAVLAQGSLFGGADLNDDMDSVYSGAEGQWEELPSSPGGRASRFATGRNQTHDGVPGITVERGWHATMMQISKAMGSSPRPDMLGRRSDESSDSEVNSNQEEKKQVVAPTVGGGIRFSASTTFNSPQSSRETCSSPRSQPSSNRSNARGSMQTSGPENTGDLESTEI